MLDNLLEILRFNWQTVLFVMITLIWWAEFIILPSKGGEDNPKKEGERRSFFLVGVGIGSSILLAIILRMFGVLNLSAYSLTVIQQLAVVIYLFGIIVRYWSLILLGDYFTRDVEVEDQQDLVSRGPYKYLRHPSYLGLFSLTLGVILFIGNLIAIPMGVIILIIALNYRIKIEEKMMLDMIGEEYKMWCKNRYRMFPLIY